MTGPPIAPRTPRDADRPAQAHEEEPAKWRPNVFEIDLDAIRHNVGEIRRLVGERVKIFAALKANAYGFGVEGVIDAMISAGADGFALVEPAEALRIRQLGVTAPILLYGGTLPGPQLVSAVERNQLTPTVTDAESATIYSKYVRRTLPVFVEIDVGMERLGCPCEEAYALVKLVQHLSGLELAGIYTHLHVGRSDDLGKYFNWQVGRFEQVIQQLIHDQVDVPIVMAASSPSLAFDGGPTFDAVDTGHLIYGLLPPVPLRSSLSLRPALRAVTSKLVQVKTVTRSEFLDSAPFQPSHGLRIGIIPLGRGDGLASFCSGEVLVRGERCRILGNLSLEHCRVDLARSPEAAVGDEVVIIGQQCADQITLDEVREARGLDSVGVVTSIRDSVTRRYACAR